MQFFNNSDLGGIELKMVLTILQVRHEWEAGTFELRPGDEDIHTANERRLKVRREKKTTYIFVNKKF